MIIEVDETTGKATTYKTLDAFTHAHKDELDSIYKKKFAPKIELDLWNDAVLTDQLPKGAGKIVRITSHIGHIVCKCENGDVYSFDRVPESPYFKIDIKPWQSEQFNR